MTISRRERDDQRRKDEILDAALSIFATQGFHGATMAQISQEAQYPLGTIYKYFSSKKQIYHDLVMERVHQLGQILISISNKKELTAREKLKESLFAKAKFYRSNSDFIRIYISERSNIDAVMLPKLNEKVNRMHQKMITLFQKIFEQGIEDEFKPYPTREMATLFTEIAHSVAWSSLFHNGNSESSDNDNKDRQNIDKKKIDNTNIYEPEQGDEEILNKRLNMVFDIFMSGVAK